MSGRVHHLRRRLPSPIPATGGDVRVYTGLALSLVSVLVVVVPAGSILLGVHPGLLLAAGGALYAVAIVGSDRAFEGTATALFVAAGFNATAFFGPSRQLGAELRLLDVLSVLVLGYLVVEEARDRTWRRSPDRTLAVGSMAAFVLWSFLAALLGDGPSTAEALGYATGQLRFLLLLAASTAFVARRDPRCVVSPLAIGMGGSLVFAVDEVFAGRAGYLVDLGPVGRAIGAVWPSTSLTSVAVESTVVYQGRAFGQSRVLVGVAIVFVSLVLAAATVSRRRALLSGGALLGIASVVASSSHAGIVGLYGALGVVLAYWTSLGLERVGPYRARRLVVPLSLVVGTLAAAWAVVATATGADSVLFVRTNNLAVRLELYRTALEVTARHPAFGLGGGSNFDAVVGRWVHNLFLSTLVAVGVPGFLAFVTSQATVTWRCVRRLGRCPPDERWLWVGIFASVVGFYLYGFWVVAFTLESMQAAYWILAGVVVGSSPVATAGTTGGGERGPDAQAPASGRVAGGRARVTGEASQPASGRVAGGRARVTGEASQPASGTADSGPDRDGSDERAFRSAYSGLPPACVYGRSGRAGDGSG